MTNITLKKHLDFVDLLKSIAIFFVLIYHFPFMENNFIDKNDSIYYVNYFFKSILSTCVPIFFFVNGGLLLNKSNLDIKAHTKKIIKLFIIFLFWGGVTLLSLSIIKGEHISIIEGLNMLFYLEENWVNHLWFLESLIVVYIFYPIIFGAFKDSKKNFYFFFVAVLFFTFFNKIIGTIATIFSLSFNDFTDTNLLSANYFSLTNPFLGIYGFSIGYFLLGGVLFSIKEKINTKKMRSLSIVILPISMFLLTVFGIKLSINKNELWDNVWNGYDTIFTVINVVALFVLSINYKHSGYLGKAIKNISSNSLGIYLIHFIIGTAFKPYYSFNGFFSELIFALILLLISTIAINLLRKIPYLKYFVAM